MLSFFSLTLAQCKKKKTEWLTQAFLSELTVHATQIRLIIFEAVQLIMRHNGYILKQADVTENVLANLF